jgi:hypothetical protein
MDGFYRVTFYNAYGDAQAWMDADSLSVLYPGLLSAWADGEISNVRVFDVDGTELRSERPPAKEQVTAQTPVSRWMYTQLPPPTAAA